MVFDQYHCDMEAFNATLHPFIRNAVACMEYGGSFLNKRLNRTNDGGTTRRTSDLFQLAASVLYQNPIQNFALAPNNLTDAPQYCLDFLQQVPTTWDETRLIDGYPGKYVVLARRSGDKWYVAGVNATDQDVKLNLNLPMFDGREVRYLSDDLNTTTKEIKVKKQQAKVTIKPNGGILLY